MKNFRIFSRACLLAAAALAIAFAVDSIRLYIGYLNIPGGNSAPFWVCVLPSCVGYVAGMVICGIAGLVFWKKAKRKS